MQPSYGTQLNTILQRIADIQITVEVAGAPRPNVIVAEPYQPSDTASTYCPFFINEVHGGSADIPISSGQQYVTSNIEMFLCVRRREAETELKLGAQETIAWRDAVFSTFAKRVKLSDPADDSRAGHIHEGLTFVLDAHIGSWEAPVEYKYASSNYLALKFTLIVNEFYVTTIAA